MTQHVLRAESCSRCGSSGGHTRGEGAGQVVVELAEQLDIPLPHIRTIDARPPAASQAMVAG
jgi:hypothetical protein